MARSDSLKKAISLQERDFALLTGLFESRVMTAAHIAALYFEGRKEAAKKRLQKLRAAGFIGERRRRAYEPAILFLTKRGLQLLRKRGVLAEYPAFDLPVLIKRARVSDLTLRHELEVMDVKAAFCAALRGSKRYSIAEFGTWPRLYEFEASKSSNDSVVLVKPDGFIRIHENESDGGLSEHTFFLEVDRSTEVLETLIARAACYIDYYRSGGFAVKNGAARSDFKEYPFRVLMVFKTRERRNNVCERLLLNIPPILTQVCLATLADVTNGPLGSIWMRPSEYRSAVSGTVHELEQGRVKFGFQRRIARDNYVDRLVERISPLDPAPLVRK